MHREAEEAVVGLEGGGVGPHGRLLLPQQRGEARQDLDVRGNGLQKNEPARCLPPRRDGLLTHLRAEAESAVACLDMTSIRALVASENFETSTGAGTLGREASGSL